MRASINISLPAPLKQWVENQTAAEGFSTASEYIRHLLREEQKRQARAGIEARLVDILSSGEQPADMTAERWEAIRKAVFEDERSEPKA